MAETIVGAISQQHLDCEPVDGNKDGKPDIQVQKVGGDLIEAYTLSGKQIVFDKALDEVGEYKINYSCAN